MTIKSTHPARVKSDGALPGETPPKKTQGRDHLAVKLEHWLTGLLKGAPGSKPRR